MSIESLEKQAEQRLDKLLAEGEAMLITEYEKALKDIKILLSDLYDKYSIDGVLTMAEMSKYNRLKSLYSNLDSMLNALGKTQDKFIKTLVGSMYNESFYRSGYALAKGAGLDINFGLISNEAVKALINKPNISGLSLAEILGKERFDLLIRQRQSIVQGFIKGDNYTNIAKGLSETFGISKNRALLIARTEGTRAQSEGQNAAHQEAKDQGIEIKRVWIASPGAKQARHYGSVLDGQVEDKNGLFHSEDDNTAAFPGGFGIAAEDCNCRCTIRSEIEGFSASEMKIPVQDIPSYEDWKKAQA